MSEQYYESRSKNIIHNKCKYLRERNHLSQRGLAIKLQTSGISLDKNAITRIETGKRKVSDFELKALAKLFHVTCDYLLDEENY